MLCEQTFDFWTAYLNVDFAGLFCRTIEDWLELLRAKIQQIVLPIMPALHP